LQTYRALEFLRRIQLNTFLYKQDNETTSDMDRNSTATKKAGREGAHACKIRTTPALASRTAISLVKGIRDRHSGRLVFLVFAFVLLAAYFCIFLQKRRGISLGQHVFNGPRWISISNITFSSIC
jgi:hypothetical protein